MIRIVQQNDWVIFIVLGCILLYIFMLLYLHRDSSVKVFLMQTFADSSNSFLSWMIISLVQILAFSTLISQTIPVVPNGIRSLNLFGYELNKFGYTLLSIFSFYIIRSALTYLFYMGTGCGSKLPYLQFTAAKFYFILSSFLLTICVYQFYFSVDMMKMFDYYFIGFIVFFLLKIGIYLLSPQHILPIKWYYKFLYICTLQIAPVIALWSVLYF